MRPARPSLLAVAAMAPVSLLALQLWSTTPPVAPPHEPGTFGTATLARAATFLAAWMLMVAAMMLPSAMPLLASLDRIAQNHPARHQIPIFAAFAYLGIWGLAGVAAWIASATSEAYILSRVSTQVTSGLAGACLILAGLYGVSPFASACLRACRRPFGFLARYWRGQSRVRRQSSRIGAAYGVSCVACCVPMLGIMFLVGMTNMAITIALGVLMVIMKTSMIGTRIAHLLAIALIGAGVAVGFGWVPVVPHHH
jgi:predicted metal-binding membrane protein